MELKNYTLNFGSEGSFKGEGSFPKFLYNVGFFGENRLAGGRFYSFGVAGDLIFALASTVPEIFAKNWNASYFFAPLKNRPYSLHALASLVR